MAIEILLPTTRTLGGATRAIVEQLLGPGFQNIDAPETNGGIEVEMMNVDMEEWAKYVPTDISAEDLGEEIKANKELVRVHVALRVGRFKLFPRFVILERPDDFEAYQTDPRARQIIGREALELSNAFHAPELIVAGDAASDFLGEDATDWESLKEVLVEEEIEHEVIPIPGR